MLTAMLLSFGPICYIALLWWLMDTAEDYYYLCIRTVWVGNYASDGEADTHTEVKQDFPSNN